MADFRAMDPDDQAVAVGSVGRVGTFAVARELELYRIARQWKAEFADRLAKASALSDVERALAAHAERIATSREFAEWHERTALVAYMGGEFMVRAVDLREESADGAKGTVRFRSAFVRDEEPAFFELPWAEAVEFFEGKEVIRPREFDRIRDRFKEGGFIARRLASDQLVNEARKQVLYSIENGATIDETVKAIRDDQLMLGLAPTSRESEFTNRAYIETVVRNNVSSAYGFGRWKAQNDPDVVALRPFMQYLAITDSRARKNHAACHLRVFRLGTDLASYYATPMGHNCRCSSRSLNERGLKKYGATVETKRVPGGYPDKGWRGDPRPLGFE